MKRKTIILSIIAFFIIGIIAIANLSYIFKDSIEYGLNVSKADNTVYIEMYNNNCNITCDYPLEVRLVKADSIAKINNIDNVSLVGTYKDGRIDTSTICGSFTFDVNSDEWNSKIDSIKSLKN